MRLLESTQSVCPVCLKTLPAWYEQEGHITRLARTCQEHGKFSEIIWQGDPAFDRWQRPGSMSAPEYTESTKQRGCPHDCGRCPDHKQHACTVLFEITDQCNLSCPVCFAQSSLVAGETEKTDNAEEVGNRHSDSENEGTLIVHAANSALYSAATVNSPCTRSGALSSGVKFTALPELEAQLDWIFKHTGNIVLQLSGGEPTLYPWLAELVAKASCLFPAVQLNSNGVLLALDDSLAQKLVLAGLSWVFLQFDGTDDAIYRTLRGRPLLAIKKKAIDNCRKAGLPVVLVSTLARGVNDGNLGAMLDFAIENAPAVRGMHIQPMALMGRNQLAGTTSRLTLPEVLIALCAQSKGRIVPEHATPPGCEHARCSFHCRYRLEPGKTLVPLHEGSCCISFADNAISASKAETCCTPAASGIQDCCAPADSVTADSLLSNPATSEAESPGSVVFGCASDAKETESALAHEAGAARAIETIIRSWGGTQPAKKTESKTGQTEEDALSRFIRQSTERSFSVTCMAFQDAGTLDLHRVQQCCVHIFAPPARLVPFCSYNLTSLDGTPLYRKNSTIGQG